MATGQSKTYQRGFDAGFAAGFAEGIATAKECLNSIPLKRMIENVAVPSLPASAPIEELHLIAQTHWSLKKAGIHTIEDLTKWSECQLTDIRRVGEKTVREIVTKLGHFGYQLGEACLDGCKPENHTTAPAETKYGLMRNNMTIEELELSTRTYHCLKKAGITTLIGISNSSACQLLNIRQFGDVCLNDVQRVLNLHGRTLSVCTDTRCKCKARHSD